MKNSPEFWLRIAVTVFIVTLIILVPQILYPFSISLILSVLLTPVADCIQTLMEKAGVRKFPYDISIILSFLLFIAVVYLVIIHILVPFITEAKSFINGLPGIILEIQQVIPELEAQYDVRLIPPELRHIINNVVSYIGSYTLQIAQFSISAIFSVASTLIEMVVVPFITFYMRKKGTAFKEAFVKLFPVQYQRHLTHLLEEIYRMLSAYVQGQLTLSVLMAMVTFLGMVALDIPYPLVIGLLAGVMELVPVLGPIIGAIPPALLGLLQSSHVMAQVIVFYIIVQQLDSHLIMPKVMGHVINVHPVAIIAGVLIGGHLFGILGMMIAVPVLAVLQVVIRHMWFYDYYKVIS